MTDETDSARRIRLATAAFVAKLEKLHDFDEMEAAITGALAWYANEERGGNAGAHQALAALQEKLGPAPAKPARRKPPAQNALAI